MGGVSGLRSWLTFACDLGYIRRAETEVPDRQISGKAAGKAAAPGRGGGDDPKGRASAFHKKAEAVLSS